MDTATAKAADRDAIISRLAEGAANVTITAADAAVDVDAPAFRVAAESVTSLVVSFALDTHAQAGPPHWLFELRCVPWPHHVIISGP